MGVTYVNNLGHVIQNYRARAGRGLAVVGREAKEYAQSIAPVDTGEYRSKIGLQPGADDREIQLVARAGHSKYVEWGTSRMPPFATLRRTLDHMKGRMPKAIADAMRGGGS